MPHRLVLSTMLAVVLASPLAAGEPSKAEQLSTAALADAKAERWDDAIDKLTRAIALQEKAGLRFRRGRCHEQLGHLRLALEDYDRADELGGYATSGMASMLAEHRHAVRARVPVVTLRLPDGLGEATFSIDGKQVSAETFSVPMRLDPGEHVLSIVAPGRRPYSRRLNLDERARFGETVDMPLDQSQVPVGVEVAPADPPPLHSPPPSTSVAGSSVPARAIVLWSGVGLAVVAGGLVVEAQIARADANDIIRQGVESVAPDKCLREPSSQACRTINYAIDRRDLADQRTAIGIAVGAAGAAAVIGTLIFWPRDPAPARVGVVATGSGVLLSGSFQ